MNNKSSLWSRLLLSALIALGMGLFATQKAQAVAINNQGTLPADQTVDDDLFISGETVSVDGTVNGLVIASGAVVNVNGTINGDCTFNDSSRNNGTITLRREVKVFSL
mgnify:CR=1 FL=1